jgi:hypothetical protein
VLSVLNEAVYLSVPKTPSGSCRERVFVDHAADPVVPADAKRVGVGDSCRTRPQWRGLGQGPVWAMGVVMTLILAQDLS